MAIENVWIIDSSSGICIYDWCHETKEKTIDEQLVSGLLLAFKNFSSEAGLVDISAIEGIDRKLAYQSDDRFIIASICHTNDYEPLINKTLQGFLREFRKKYKSHLEEDSSSDVSPYRTFDENIETKLEGSTTPRTWISLLVGSIVGMFVIGAVFLAFALTRETISNVLPETGDIVGLIILLIGFIIGGFVGGLLAGDRKYGMIASFILVIIIFALFVAFFSVAWETIEQRIFYPLVYLLTFTILSLSGGYTGGFLRERRSFYPMTTDI
ncbi:MAG: hypothetical protein FK731_02270 [Asgard group archaeon]|nr:hypothetical protein [Asgard group archaeon]